MALSTARSGPKTKKKILKYSSKNMNDTNHLIQLTNPKKSLTTTSHIFSLIALNARKDISKKGSAILSKDNVS